MLEAAEELRLFGVRYRTIAFGLSAAAVVLVVLLTANIFRDQAKLAPALTPEALQHLQGEGIRLTALALLLAVTVAGAVLTWRATTQQLSWVQDTTKAILESLAGGVLTVDLQGRIGIINRAALQMLEIAPEPVDPLRDIGWLAQRQPLLAQLIHKAVFEREYVQDHDAKIVNSSGQTVFLRVTISEEKNERGARKGIIVLLRDATRMVNMDRELRKRDRLAAAGTLAAGVAHEIRNPLSALELNIRLMRDEVLSPEPNREEVENYFDVLVAETRRLNRITSNFLQLTRPVPLSMSPLEVGYPLRQVIRLLEIEARERKIAFRVRSTNQSSMVLGDFTKLEQLFLNILINAMQATPEGGEIQIESRQVTEDDGDFVDVAFTDSGAGISPEDMARLFDPYFTTRDGGTGLGLPIADRIATDHGGKIFVESMPGTGTTVTVRLPLAKTQREPGDASSPGDSLPLTI